MTLLLGELRCGTPIGVGVKGARQHQTVAIDGIG